MNNVPIVNLIPEKYRGWFLLCVAAFPYLTRAFYAVISGGGLSGIFHAVLFGTNIPPKLQTSANGTSNVAGSKIAAVLLALLLPALFFAGCATQTLSSNAFTAESAAASTTDVAMKGYATLWQKEIANPAAYHRTADGLNQERATVEAASIKIGSSIELVEDLRASYVTNAAVAPQLNAAIAALGANAGSIVTLVSTFENITNSP